jgi:hypothetical protein
MDSSSFAGFHVVAEASKCAAFRVLSVRRQKTKNLPAAKSTSPVRKESEFRVHVNRNAIFLVGPRTVTGLPLFCQAEMLSTEMLRY